jgi:hypothetical protein
MKHLMGFLFLYIVHGLISISESQTQENNYPQAQISNEHVVMKLYLPDKEKGYYRAARFDWSGIISSLEYNGHNYFGEWKPTHDPKANDNITGTVEAFRGNGLGFDEAAPGSEFMRIGVGMLEKQIDTVYYFNKNYKIIDFGKWTIEKGSDWIQFQHKLSSKAGWAYTYTKKITLLKDKPGYTIYHNLENTGLKTIETDQFNHNFFVIDGDTTGPDFNVEFPFSIISADGLSDPTSSVYIEKKQILFNKKLSNGYVWIDLKGFSNVITDHQFRIINKKAGVGVQMNNDKPLYRMVFWATTKTLCPENYVFMHIEPGKSESWTSKYILFSK